MTILHRTDDDAITTLTMDAPARLNALSDEMIAALHDAFDQIADDPSVKVVVLKGTGKAFCAGHNLKEMQAKSSDELKNLFDRCATMMMRIQSLPQPVIAQVHGLATAAGCQLVATCDLAVADTDCKFGVNGVNIGLFCSTPMVALTRNIGKKAAFEMLTTGEFLTSDQALALGLINRHVAADQLDTEARSLATKIAGKLGSAVRIGKAAFYVQAQMTTAEAYAFTGDVMVENMGNADTSEGIAAFLEKRHPKWAL